MGSALLGDDIHSGPIVELVIKYKNGLQVMPHSAPPQQCPTTTALSHYGYRLSMSSANDAPVSIERPGLWFSLESNVLQSNYYKSDIRGP